MQSITLPIIKERENLGKTLRDMKPEGFTERQADVVGCFAIHNSLVSIDDGPLTEDPEQWTVTHIPSGGAITAMLWTKESAIWLVEQIKHLTDWETFGPESSDYWDVYERLKPIRLTAFYKSIQDVEAA